MISTDYVLSLYRRFQEDLKKVRLQQYWFLRRHFNGMTRRLLKMGLRRHILTPMLDDLEAEVTYLLIRDQDPKSVVEMSPNTGWSTTWILSALRDNGGKGRLWSYDIHDTCTKYVPRSLSNSMWTFHLGDARKTLSDQVDFDYLFIDSDHSRSFAQWYIRELLPRCKPQRVFSVHDVFHEATPSEEGEEVIAWAQNKGLSYWTPSPAASPSTAQDLLTERHGLGMSYPVHKRGKDNPMMFYVLAQGATQSG